MQVKLVPLTSPTLSLLLGRSALARKTRSDDTGPSQRDLDAVMEQVPKGALALASAAVLLLLCGWFFVYFFIFVPRGSVG
jgi:hypothetical protein